jgi:hypothetical protein
MIIRNEENIKEILLDFSIYILNKLFPEESKKITLSDVDKVIYYFFNKHFEFKEKNEK